MYFVLRHDGEEVMVIPGMKGGKRNMWVVHCFFLAPTPPRPQRGSLATCNSQFVSLWPWSIWSLISYGNGNIPKKCKTVHRDSFGMIHGIWTSRCVLTIQEVRMEHRGSWECEVNMINNEDDNHATWHDLLLAELSPKAKGLKSAGARGLQRGMARHGVQSTSRRKRGSATMTMTKTKTKTKCFNHVFL